MTKPKKQTRLARAGDIGISIPTLDSWSRCGIDVFDDEQVRGKIARMRNLPPTLKPDWHPKTTAAIKVPGDDPTELDIESIIAQLASVTDKHQAQTVKIQIDGLLNAYKLREAAGKYVSKRTAKDAMLKITSAVNAMMLRMANDLPPMLDGLGPEAMEEVISAKADEIISYLRDIESEAYEPRDSTN